MLHAFGEAFVYACLTLTPILAVTTLIILQPVPPPTHNAPYLQHHLNHPLTTYYLSHPKDTLYTYINLN